MGPQPLLPNSSREAALLAITRLGGTWVAAAGGSLAAAWGSARAGVRGLGFSLGAGRHGRPGPLSREIQVPGAVFLGALMWWTQKQSDIFAVSTDAPEGGNSALRRLRGGDQAPLGEPPSSASKGGTFTFFCCFFLTRLIIKQRGEVRFLLFFFVFFPPLFFWYHM